MGIYYRTIAILIELTIFMAITCSLLVGMNIAIFDLGLDLKYRQFIKWVLTIMGCLALIFFASHLIAFYPRISP